MHQVIARTWRPQRFSEVVGQRHVTQTLQNALRLNRVGHGYVFSGQRGVGKTTVARLLAKALNCQKGPAPEPCNECDSCREIAAGRSVDVIEIDAASNRGIDAVRELRENVRYATARDRYKVFIIDEAHQITPEGFNALLKTLEEPPPHVVFILATTELHELPETILSRCQHFAFHAATFAEVLEDLRKICAAEAIQADAESLAALAAAAGGSLRDAQSRLEQAITAFGSPLEGPAVLRLLGAVPSQLIEEVFHAVKARDRAQVLRVVARLVDEGYQIPHFCSQLVRAVRNLLVTKVAGAQPGLLESSPEETERLVALAADFSEEDLLRFLEILLALHQQLRFTTEPRFHLEVGLFKLVEAERLVAIEELLAQSEGSGSSRAGDEPPSPGPRAPGGRPGSAAGAGQAPSAPGLSPFERDSLRKRQNPSAPAGAPPQPEHSSEPSDAPLAGGSSPSAPDPVSADADSHSREQAWPSEAMRLLEARGKHGLVSLLTGARWEFGESEVRLRPASAGLAAILTPSDRQAVEQLISEVAGRNLRLSLIGEPASNAAQPRAGTAARRPADRTPASDSSAETAVRQDPEVREFERLFGTTVTGIRKRKE